jgi:hypothetical protein
MGGFLFRGTGEEVSSMKTLHRNTSQRIRAAAGALAVLALLPSTVQAGMPSWMSAGRVSQAPMVHHQMEQSADRTGVPRVLLVSRKALPPPPPPSSVSAVVAWDPNTESDLMGYKLYVGTSSGVYGSAIDVGNYTDYEVRNLEPGRTYYFSVTAYDLSGNESSFADEISNTLSTTSISCSRDGAGQLVCTNG